jgi:hypothetical protein
MRQNKASGREFWRDVACSMKALSNSISEKQVAVRIERNSGYNGKTTAP